MLLLFPVMLYMLQRSLNSPEGFVQVQTVMSSLPLRVLGALTLWLFVHHLFAGIRVLLIDIEWGSDLVRARRSARVVLIAALLVGIAGVML